MITRQLMINIFLCILFTGCKYKKVELEAFGTLELDRILLQTKVAEEIIEIPVAQGSIVKQGQVILRLQDKKQQELVSIAKAELKKTEAYLAKLRKGAREEDINLAIAVIEGEVAKLINAEQEVARSMVLIEKNALNTADFDKTIAIRDTAKARHKVAEEKLIKLKNGACEEDIAQAEAECAKAYANLVIEQNKLEDYTIKATRNGRLDALFKHQGEQVQVGTIIAIILAEGKPYARVYMPEAMRSKVNIGSNLRIHVDKIKKTFQGTVRNLATDPAFTPYYALNQKERSRLVYLAEIELIDADEIPIGLPVQVVLP